MRYADVSDLSGKMVENNECDLQIPLLISGEGADRWFCREKGSTEYKSIQENGSKCATKYKSRETKMAAHYKIQNKDH